MCYTRKLNITFNFRFHMYEQNLKSVTSHALGPTLPCHKLSHLVGPLERNVLYRRPPCFPLIMGVRISTLSRLISFTCIQVQYECVCTVYTLHNISRHIVYCIYYYMHDTLNIHVTIM